MFDVVWVLLATVRLFVRQHMLGFAPFYGSCSWIWLLVVLLCILSRVLQRYLSRRIGWLIEGCALAFALTNSFLLLVPLQILWFVNWTRRLECHSLAVKRTTLDLAPRFHMTLLLVMMIQWLISLWILLGGQALSGSLVHHSLLHLDQDVDFINQTLQDSLISWFEQEGYAQNTWRPHLGPLTRTHVWIQSDVGCTASLAQRLVSNHTSRASTHVCLLDSDPLPTAWRAYTSLVTSSVQAGQELLFRSESRLLAAPLPQAPEARIGILPWGSRIAQDTASWLESNETHTPDIWLVSASSAPLGQAFVLCNAGSDVTYPASSFLCTQEESSLPWTIYRSKPPLGTTLALSTHSFPHWTHADLGSMVQILLYQTPHPLQDTLVSTGHPGDILYLASLLRPTSLSNEAQHIRSTYLFWRTCVAPWVQRREWLRALLREYDLYPLARFPPREQTHLVKTLGVDQAEWRDRWIHMSAQEQLDWPRPGHRTWLSLAQQTWIAPLLDVQTEGYKRLALGTTLRNLVLVIEASHVWWLLYWKTWSFVFPTERAQFLMHMLGQVLIWVVANVVTRLWYAWVLGIGMWDANVILMRPHDVIHVATTLLCLVVIPLSMGLWMACFSDKCHSQWTVRHVHGWSLSRSTVTWFLWVGTGLLPQVGVQSLFPWIWNTPSGGSSWRALSWALQGVLQSMIWIGFQLWTVLREERLSF
jgi:hypothetical protein